jgi:hypothetical protein
VTGTMGTFPLTVAGTGGGLTHTASATMTVIHK